MLRAEVPGRKETIQSYENNILMIFLSYNRSDVCGTVSRVSGWKAGVSLANVYENYNIQWKYYIAFAH